MKWRQATIAALLCGCCLVFACCLRAESMPELVSVQKIWENAPHNAFTDLIRFQDRWWCTFREANSHGADEGKIRIIVSDDGETWSSSALLSEADIDLRDSKLSITPDGRLMCNMGGVTWSSAGAYVTRAPRIAFSDDGYTWTAPQVVLGDDPEMDHWLWRVTWKDGVAWSMSKLGEGTNPRRIMLYNSTNGLDWDLVTEPILPDNAENGSETTLRFLPDDTMVALTRPEWIGTSTPPYTNWAWTRLDAIMGGPNFVRLPDGSLWATARSYVRPKSTVLAAMTTTNYTPVLTLPSGGDTSYAGMVWHDDLLWISYYSSHGGTGADIYLAKIKMTDPDYSYRGPGYKLYVAASQASVTEESDRVYCFDSRGEVVWDVTDPSPADDNLISIALDTNGLLCVTTWDGHSYFRFSKTDGEYVDQFSIFMFPVDLAFGPDGYLYVVHDDGPVDERGVHRYNGVTGAHIDHFIQSETQTTMRGLAFGPDGYLYVSGSTNVMRYNALTGAWIDQFVTGTSLDRMCWRDGYLYVSEKGSNSSGWTTLDGSVLRFDSSGTPLGAFVAAGAGGLKSPEGLGFLPNGDLLVCDYYPDHKIRRYDGTTGAYIDDHPAIDGWPRSIVIEPDPPPPGSRLLVM